jgi:hypothetical protein
VFAMGAAVCGKCDGKKMVLKWSASVWKNNIK